MLLGKVQQPRSKTDLVKSLTNLRNVEFKIFEDIGRGNSSDIKREFEKFIGNKTGTVVVFRSKN